MGEGRGQGASPALRELNDLPPGEAVDRLRACCASGRWARGVAAARPFADLEALLRCSDEAWSALGAADRREALEHHPRLGADDLRRKRFEGTRALSRREQAGVLSADRGTRQALAGAQEEYERRFGTIFLICASGRPATEILAELERRMSNDPKTELEVAAEELRKITRLRLAAVFGEAVPGPGGPTEGEGG